MLRKQWQSAHHRLFSFILGWILLVVINPNVLAVNADDFKQLVTDDAHPVQFKQSSAVKIAVVYPGFQSSDYWQRSIRSLTGRLDAIELDYHLDVRFSAPAEGVDLQVRQIKSVLSKEPDYLILTINSLQQQRIVELLLEQDKPKIIVQNLTRPVKEWFDFQPFLYVGFDHAQGALELADYFKARFPKGTPYGLLFWNKGVVSDQRGLTFERAVSGYHDLKASYFTNASREMAKANALALITEYPEIKYIYACTTDVALGAVDAIHELGREDIVINGWGGGLAEIEAFERGDLDVLLMRMNDQNGVAIAEAISLDRQKKEVPLVFSGDFSVLHNNSTPEILRTLISKAFIYSGP